jgi:hypothetical protein
VNTQSKNDDSKGPGGTEGRESAVEGDSGDDKKEEKSAGRGDEPSQDEVRSSIQRAEVRLAFSPPASLVGTALQTWYTRVV